MKQIERNEPNPVASILDELKSFRDSKALAMFEIYVDRGWFRNLFSVNERWIEVQLIEDDYMQINLLSRQRLSVIPANWESRGESQWVVPVNEVDALSEWITDEWVRIRNLENMRLKMWTD